MSKSNKNINMKIFTDEGPDKYYLLGAIATDGCLKQYRKEHISGSIAISSKDLDWLQLINNYVAPSDNLIYKDKGCYSICFNRTELFKLCLEYDITKNKSLTLQFSKKIPEQYLPDFIRGCVDGDGSIAHLLYNKTKKSSGKVYQYIKSNVYLCGASKQFLLDFKSIVDNKNITSTFFSANKIGDINIIEDRECIVQI